MKLQRILIADNDHLLRKALQEALEGAGYKVVTVSDGLEALESIKNNPPDAVILDLVMPRVDGARVCEYLKADPQYQHIPVILLTGLAVELAPYRRPVFADAIVAKRRLDETIAYIFSALAGLESGQPVSVPLGTGGLSRRGIVVDLLTKTEYLESILAAIQEGVMVLDRKGWVSYANPAAGTLLGCPSHHLVSSTLEEIVGAEQANRLEGLLRDPLPEETDGGTVIEVLGNQLEVVATPLRHLETLTGHVVVLRKVAGPISTSP
jgi:CheY-like chemotaxis protein